MRWRRALTVWLLIVVAESIHGTLRQVSLTPVLGDLRARQAGVAVGSVILFALAWATIRWVGARSFAEQVRIGALWVILTLLFEVGLGAALGYTRARMLADYDLASGGLLGLGMLFMLFAPALAAKVRGFG